jgi:hypothetical protein
MNPKPDTETTLETLFLQNIILKMKKFIHKTLKRQREGNS